MTPKDKAKELYNKFYNTSSHPHHVESRKNNAKQCVLIAVDEIMNVIIGSYDYELEKIYWQDVKNEILAL
jgi:hypothetical protein